MAIKQLSIFLENKPGTLLKLTQDIAEKNINLKAISLADTYDFGIARIIVDKTQEVAEQLRKMNYVVNIANVIAVEIPDRTGSLKEVLSILHDASSNVEYMYGFTGKKTNSAYMIIRPTDSEKAEKALTDKRIKMLDDSQLENI